MRPAILTLAVTATVFVALFLLERFLPLRRRCSSLLPRVILNLIISAAAFAVAAILVRPAAITTLNWATQKPFGLVHLIALPPALGFIASFLLMDLTFYWWHLANHRIGFLWRFHNVHHIDPDLDVSTGFRFHFGEVTMSAAFRVVQVLFIGISMPAFAVYELVFQANTLFHHSNLRLPIRLERLLNKVLVTPRMHGIHHSQVQREMNSNFGVVFWWWDKLHRTIGLNIPQSKIEVGIAGYSAPDDNRLWHALLMPFRKQRDYWRRSDGTLVERETAPMQQNRATLAE